VTDLFTDFGDNAGLFLAPWLKKFGAEILVSEETYLMPIIFLEMYLKRG